MMQVNGGISRYFFELIQRLSTAGPFAPTLFAGFYQSQLPLRKMRRCRVLGVRRFKVGSLWRSVLRTCDATNRLLLRGLAPAIYHPTYYRPITPPARTRMVVTVYDMIHEKFPDILRDDETVELKRAACAAAAAIICISESARRDLLELYPQFSAKTSVVYLAASPAFVDCPQASNEAAAGEPPYALFVGSRHGYKGFDLVLEAWQQIGAFLPALRLLCVGGGAFTASEFAEIERRNLHARISQRTASDAQLAELYRAAMVFVYPSRYEGFGLPVLEAMACGCPVICSRSSSLPEVGGEAASYFEPGDASSLAARVVEVLGSASRRAELIQSGYGQSRRFSWDECARQTAEVYRRCLDTV